MVRLWAVLQNLRILAAGSPYLAPEEVPTLPEYGIKANGNWSVRELYTTLDQILQNSAPIWPWEGPGPGSEDIPPFSRRISLKNLIIVMNMITKGTLGWTCDKRNKAE